MTIEKHELKVSTTGSAGSASGSAVLTLPLCELVAVHVNFHSSAPSTSDTTFTASGNPLAVTLLTLTNDNTDKWLYPKTQDHDNTGSVVTGSYSSPVIHNGSLTVTLAQYDALTNAVVVTVYVRV